MQALSVEQGIAAERLRRWVSTMVLLGALARLDDDGHRFLLKGGVAIQLRLRLRARTTKDVDIIVIPDGNADIVDALEDTLAQPYLAHGLDLGRYAGDDLALDRHPHQGAGETPGW